MPSRIVRAGIELEAEQVQWALAGTPVVQAKPQTSGAPESASKGDAAAAARFEQRLREALGLAAARKEAQANGQAEANNKAAEKKEKK